MTRRADLDAVLASFTPDPAWATVSGSWGPCFDAAVAFSRHLQQAHVPHRIVGLHGWARLAEHPVDALGRPMRGPHHVVVARGRVDGQEGAWSVDWCWAWSGCASDAYPDVRPARALWADWQDPRVIGRSADDCDRRLIAAADDLTAWLRSVGIP